MTGTAGANKMPAGTTSGASQVLREYDKVVSDCPRDGVDHPATCGAWWNWN
jgi:hypothetical protein